MGRFNSPLGDKIMEYKIELMRDLINDLNRASSLYYNTGTSWLSDEDYDLYYSRLEHLEGITGIVFSDSPTHRVGAYVLDNIPKRDLGERPMLSLGKVHSIKEIEEFANGHKIIGSYKLDGLSVRLYYENGNLIWASTRGNGTTGSDITQHIHYFTNVPLSIPKDGIYIIDGEAIITKYDFEEIKKQSNIDYKNPRNLAAGTLNLLDMEEVKKRKLTFIAWDVIEGDESNSYEEKIMNATSLGFETIIPFYDLDNEKVSNLAKAMGLPCDGVVWRLDDIAYGESLGATSHHFNNGIAWKPKDESAWTELLDIEWGMGRTGTLTPIAVFSPVELEGTIVERASLHNITIMKETLQNTTGWQGQNVCIEKKNMIIPQIVAADYYVSENQIDFFNIPTICPICGSPLEQITEVDSTILRCPAADCIGKLLNRLEHFCSKKGLDIKGLSKATLEKLIDWDWVNEFADLYHLKVYRDEWISKPGFGAKSVDNILEAIERSRTPNLSNFLSAIGIPQVGNSLVNDIVPYYFSDYQEFRQAVNTKWDFTQIDGIGVEKANAILTYNYEEADRVYEEFIATTTSVVISETPQILEGHNIVITGRLEEFKNRDELVARINECGGRVSSSVSKNTTLLINNDIESNSSKNKDAKRLGIPIITEKNFLENYLTL